MKKYWYVCETGEVLEESKTYNYNLDEIEYLGQYKSKQDAINNSVFDLH